MKTSIILDDSGKELSLLAELTVIPGGHTLLICPSGQGGMTFFSERVVESLKGQFETLGIRVLVVQAPIAVWAIADSNARP